MSPLYLHNGILLVDSGALAAGQDCCCCQNNAVEWRIWEAGYEYGYPNAYPNGPINNNILVGLPCCWIPPIYEYQGFVKLQVRCDNTDPGDNNSWKTIDAWVTLNGGPEKCFSDTYPDPCCPGTLKALCSSSSSSSSSSEDLSSSFSSG